MKLLCDVNIINRLAPHVKNRTVKSTLAIGYHPPNKENSELFLILFTAQNKSGQRYKIRENVQKVFTRFITEGKTTISFKVPDHDLQIKCDPVQLKFFLNLLKKGIDGNFNPGEKNSLPTLAVQPLSQKSRPVAKLMIKSRSDYPLKGFPRTLTTLYINGIRRCSIDRQIFLLRNLTVLNLSDNCINKIPKEIGKLKLTEFDISKNSIGDPDPDNKNHNNWLWLNEPEIQQSLISLNIASNNLKHFPSSLIKLKKLVTLNLNNNYLTKIPHIIKYLIKLRYFYISNNHINTIASAINFLNLDIFDFSLNQEYLNEEPIPQVVQKEHNNNLIGNKINSPLKLWQIAAQCVVNQKLPLTPDKIPATLIDKITFVPVCECNNLCFNQKYSRIANSIIHCRELLTNRNLQIGVEFFYCSQKCYGH